MLQLRMKDNFDKFHFLKNEPEMFLSSVEWEEKAIFHQSFYRGGGPLVILAAADAAAAADTPC